MTVGKRFYLVVALVTLLALAGVGAIATSRIVSASNPDSAPATQACDHQDEADDAESAIGQADTEDTGTDEVEDQCGDENEADDDSEQAQSGVLDDGKDLLPQAGITLAQAIAAAQTAASGAVGEVDLEYYQGNLVFNVDIGDKDVKVDAANGSILAIDVDD